MSGFARHRRSAPVIANFTGFEADLLRSLAAQLVELLRNEARRARATTSDPLEAMIDFSGPDRASPRTRCWRGCSRRRTPTTRRRPASSAGSPRARCATARPTPRSPIIDALEEAGLPPELTEEGLIIDVELDEADAETWLRSFTDIRLALATRLEVEEGDEEYWAPLPDDDPRAQAHDIYEWVGYLQETLVDALAADLGWRGADPRVRRRDAQADRAARDVAARASPRW